MTVDGKTFGLIGGLAAFPRRLAAREIARQGGGLQHGVTRRTEAVVFGRKLLAIASADIIERHFDQQVQAGRALVSENGLLRILRLKDAQIGAALGRQALLDQAKLDARSFDLLALFDTFEHDAEPFSFRDLILARKYAGLLAGGATWHAIARSIHRSGPIASLTAVSLQAERGDTIYARLAEGISELDGQVLLPFVQNGVEDQLDELLAQAESAEEIGRHTEAAELYRRCLAVDPSDAWIAFNRANCLRESGQLGEAHRAYLSALKQDPKFSEAWFNLACMAAKDGRIDAARRHFLKAIALDGDYADPVYNLANLEFEAGGLEQARKWWVRYLELDNVSDWANAAARGIQYVDLEQAHRTAS